MTLRTRWYLFLEKISYAVAKVQGRVPDRPCPRQAEATMQVQREHLTRWRRDGTCSYCGSLSPEKFFSAIREGHQLCPTDKDYKVYVRTRDGMGKFYFQHLEPSQRKHFVKLVNDGVVRLATPGYFPVLPFFMGRKKAGDGS